MSRKENEKSADNLSSTEKPRDVFRDDPLADTSGLISQEIPPGVDRRNFLIRSAVGGAAAVMTGRSVSAKERTARAIATLPPDVSGWHLRELRRRVMASPASQQPISLIVILR